MYFATLLLDKVRRNMGKLSQAQRNFFRINLILQATKLLIPCTLLQNWNENLAKEGWEFLPSLYVPPGDDGN